MTDKERKTPELIYKETETKQGYKLITEIWLNYNEDVKYAECESCGRHIRTGTIQHNNEPVENEG